MILRHIKIGCIFLLFCLPLLFLGIKLNSDRVMLLSKGNYFFEKTRNSADINLIVVKFDKDKTISISKKNDLWHIKEADDYYASFAKINSLVLLIRNTIIHRADVVREKELEKIKNNKSITIQSFDKRGNIIDEAIIFEKNINNKNHYGLLNGDNFLYQISGDFNITSNPMEWVQMPILKIANKEIKEIKTDKFDIYRAYEGDKFIEKNANKAVGHIDSFINALWYLTSTQVIHSVNFNASDYKKLRTYEIKLFNGIIYKIVFYKKNDEYIISVDLDRDLLMSKEGAKWLKENSVLYNGWFFKLNPDIGEILAEFSI